MALTVAPTSVGTTTFDPTIGNLAADGTHEYQISPRPDFRWCVAPLLPGSRVTNPTFTGLNAGSKYYFRARSIRADDTIEDWSNIVAFTTGAGAARDVTPAAIMIEPAMIVVPEMVLSWTVQSELPEFPAANMAHDGPTMWFTDRNSANHPVEVELGEVDIDTIAILGTNLSEAATVTITAGSTTSYSDYSSGVLPFRASANLPGRRSYHGLFDLGSVQRHRYWRVQITDDRQPRGLAVQHMVFGLNRVSKNHAVEKVETAVDLSNFQRNAFGNPVRAERFRGRRVEFDIATMKEERFETQYADLFHLVGTTSPVLCVPNSKSGAFLHDRILFGPIIGGRAVNVASPFYTRVFSVDSII